MSQSQMKTGEVTEKFDQSSSSEPEIGVVRSDDPKKSKNPLVRFNYYMEQLGGETKGIARIPEDERYDDSIWDTATMWVGANTVIAAFALGMLGESTFKLNLRDSIATIICFATLGAFAVASLSTFGPPTGMRQMVLSRYWFGSIGSRICAFLNSLTCIGWSSVNTLAAVTALRVVNYQNRPIPIWAGVFFMSMVSWVIAVFGYRIVHLYERYAWIPNLIVFFTICICLGQDHLMDWQPMESGPIEAGSVLSFGSSVYGFAAGWGPYSSDYTCYKPKNTSRFKVFIYIWFFASISCIGPMVIGAFAAQRAAVSPDYRDFMENNPGGSTGGILWKILVDDKLNGFGQFMIVIFSLSTIANNVPNLYTFSVSSQAILPYFDKIPQYIWATIITGASIGIGIGAYGSFQEYLGQFMNVIAYWISFYYGIVLAEHLFFRRSYDNYNIDAYNSFVRLPFGASAIFAGCCGCAGTAVGMSQPWWVGPIADLFGKPGLGGDLGFELSFSFAFTGLVLTRWIERWLLPDESYVSGTDGAWWRLGFLNFKHLETPAWMEKHDTRYWWARKTGQAPPGEGGPAEGVYKHDISNIKPHFSRAHEDA